MKKYKLSLISITLQPCKPSWYLGRSNKRQVIRKIPESHCDLLKDETRTFVYLATRMPFDPPSVTPIWSNTGNETLLVNSAEGRVKDKDIRCHSDFALCIQKPANPCRYLQILGHVAEISEEGEKAHIDELAGKYAGNFKYQHHQPGI